MVGRALSLVTLAWLVLPLAPARAGSASEAREASNEWAELAALADPAERAQALSQALDAAPELPPEALQVGFRVGVEEAAALRLENARLVQAALHRRARAPWSAMDLALTLARSSERAASERILDEQLQREGPASPARADLLSRYALVALGEGDDDTALDRLGHALCAGSPDAAVVLAKHHLSNGRLEAAQAGFRALLVDGDPRAWALRGWGLTLIHPSGSPAPDDQP